MILIKVTTVKNVWFASIGFFNNGFKFQDSIWNGCNVLTMLSVNISDIAVIIIKIIDTHRQLANESIVINIKYVWALPQGQEKEIKQIFWWEVSKIGFSEIFFRWRYQCTFSSEHY